MLEGINAQKGNKEKKKQRNQFKIEIKTLCPEPQDGRRLRRRRGNIYRLFPAVSQRYRGPNIPNSGPNKPLIDMDEAPRSTCISLRPPFDAKLGGWLERPGLTVLIERLFASLDQTRTQCVVRLETLLQGLWGVDELSGWSRSVHAEMPCAAAARSVRAGRTGQEPNPASPWMFPHPSMGISPGVQPPTNLSLFPISQAMMAPRATTTS